MIRRTAFQCRSWQQSDHFGTDEKYWLTQWLSFVSFDWMSDADAFTEPLGRWMDPTTVDPGIRQQ